MGTDTSDGTTGRSAETSIAVLSSGDLPSQVVQEMLVHLGYRHTILDTKSDAMGSYPVLVSSSDGGTTALGEANASRAIRADRVVDIDRVLSYLMGLERANADELDPFVSREEEKLSAAIESKAKERGVVLRKVPNWPGGAPAACILTHDIDWLTYSPFHKVVLGSGLGLGGSLRLLLGGLANKNYGWNLDAILSMERSKGFRSSLYFMAAYPGQDGLMRRSMDAVSESRSEVGLHGSWGGHLDLARLQEELRAFRRWTNAPVRGLRHHILKFSAPATWTVAEEAGMEYDSTLAYNRLFGFRGGVCVPYHPFTESRRMPLVELPTSFMDFCALHRGLRGKAAEEMLERLMATVERYHGVLVVDFHNTYLNRETFPDVVLLYEALLDKLTKRGYWVATAHEVVEWWKERENGMKDHQGGAEEDVP